jgi:hypothetical protein
MTKRVEFISVIREVIIPDETIKNYFKSYNNEESLSLKTNKSSMINMISSNNKLDGCWEDLLGEALCRRANENKNILLVVPTEVGVMSESPSDVCCEELMEQTPRVNVLLGPTSTVVGVMSESPFKNSSELKISHIQNNMTDVDNNDSELKISHIGNNMIDIDNTDSELKISHIENNMIDIDNTIYDSIKWYLNDYGCLLDEIQDDKLKKKIGKRLSGDARAMIAKFAKIKEPNSQKLLETCYTKE